MLEIQGIGKRFGGSVALTGVDLSVRAGEFFSLLGPSGCGKTTLLRIIAGFEAADEGNLRLGGEGILGVPAHRRRFNLVFQRYALFPHLDVGGNVAFGLEVKKLPRREILARVAEALELVSLSGHERRAVDTLSGGQQQRVAIARAIVNRPEVLLLDEPLSALDLKLRQRMQVELLALQRRLGMTFLYVTHAQDEALTLSDRIAVMNRGGIEQVGTPREIYDRPKTPFVATFIGQVNRLSGTVVGHGHGTVSLKICDELVLTAPPADTASERLPLGARATLLVRPERVVLGPLSAVDGFATLPVTVTRVLFKGAGVELLAELRGLPDISLAAALPREAAAALPEPGGEATLFFRQADAFVMPGEVEA